MKKQHISDPAIIEIFRVQKDQNMIDSEKRSWNGVSLLQGAMESYDPDKYQAVVLTKLTQDSAVTRNKIEELDIEERQGTTALFAELLTLDQPTKELLNKSEELNKVLWIDSDSGKLVGVVITGKDVPEAEVKNLQTKIFRGKLYPELIVVQQMPVSFKQANDVSLQNDKSAEDLMNAIKRYLSRSLGSGEQDSKVEEGIAQQLPSDLKPETSGQSEKTGVEEEEEGQETSGPEPQQPMTNQATKPGAMQSRFKNKRERTLVQKNTKISELQDEPEKLDAAWLNSSTGKNWKQRKNRDRSIVELSELVFGLLKSNSAPTQEALVSFLASLSVLQLEFFEDLINSIGTAAKTEVQEPVSSKVTQENHLETDHQHEQNNIGEKNMVSSDVKVPVAESVSTDTDTGTEEFSEISQEEKELHFKILEYQQKHNVSYDRAASAVLK